MTTQHMNDQLLRIGSVEISLRQSEELFRAYVESANDMVYTVDLDGVLTYINSYGLKLLGCSSSEVLGRSYLEFVSPPYREQTAQAFSNLIYTGELRDFEFVVQPAVGTELHLEVNGRLLYRDGDLIGGMGIGRDVTDRKAIEQELKMFSRAVESAYDSATITDLNGKILYANSATGRIFNWQPDMLLGTHAAVFFPERKQTEWLIEQAIAVRDMRGIAGGWSGEVICSRRNGDTFPALVSVGPILDEKHRATAVSFITRDITQQKSYEAELGAKNLELERASRLKSDFLANMSHELRTPLTSILGFSSILQKQIFGDLNSKQQIYVHQINQSGQHLLGLINDVLDLSKVEAGQMRLEIAPLVVSELCESTLAIVDEQARMRNLTVNYMIEPDLEPLMADELRVRQMLLNLLSNAIKFSEEGGEIGLNVKMQEECLHLMVWDTGIGIPHDKQHLLFQPFQQIDGSLSRRHEGTGLGLALTRKLAELHAGTVKMQSIEGEGSQFTICLPMVYRNPTIGTIMIEPNRR
ncbi:PAS domain S-box protein [Myxacorys almedinensis]|uniref:Circadian input-output histidine kinase CikA n=1 Tax=Myxacorys almedinensis A TaxID=2690445 RepID=A0A8J8CIV5_9CYAN|nr:PAS domain S-box protein [Myxacorys almedinensis]NDJ16941.1 PAS domain S-box protein [Myxacorys almedinensis A]